MHSSEDEQDMGFKSGGQRISRFLRGIKSKNNINT